MTHYQLSAEVRVGRVSIVVVERSELRGACFGEGVAVHASKEPYAVLVRSAEGVAAMALDGSPISYADVRRDVGADDLI